MKTSLLSHALWALAVATAFVAGYFAGDAPTARDASTLLAASPNAAPPGSGSEGDTSRASFDERIASIASAHVALTGDEARALTFEVLAEPNRIERMRKLCELLPSVTSENWRAALDGFQRQMRTEGRMSSDNWDIMLERVGEVAGAAALADALSSEEPRDQHRVGWLFKGWLARDPKAGVEWFQAQAAETQKSLRSELAVGVSRADPKQAIELVVVHPELRGQATNIMANAIQRSGFRGAEELLASISARSDIADAMKGDFFLALSQRKLRMIADSQGGASAALDWLDAYIGQPYVGANASRGFFGRAAAADPQATMTWLEARADRLTPDQAEAAAASATQTWQGQAPEQFKAWMNANPDHPLHDAMAQNAASSLARNGSIDEARQWEATIRNPAVRATLDQLIQKAEANIRRNQPGPPK